MNDNEATAAIAAPTSMLRTLRVGSGEGIGARVTWSIRDVAGALVLVVLGYILVPLAFVGPALVAGYGEKDSLVLGLALAATLVWNALLVCLVAWLAKRRGGDWTSLGWRKPWGNQAWPTGKVVGLILAGLVSMWAIQGVYVGLINAFGLEDLLPDQQFPDGVFDEWWLIALMGCAVILGAPISEELFFRGFVFAGLRRRFAVLPPALMTGALFSMAHLQLGLLIPFSLIGMVLSLVYERTGSIWFNIALHLIFNTVSFLVLVLVPDVRS